MVSLSGVGEEELAALYQIINLNRNLLANLNPPIDFKRYYFQASRRK